MSRIAFMAPMTIRLLAEKIARRPVGQRQQLHGGVVAVGLAEIAELHQLVLERRCRPPRSASR